MFRRKLLVVAAILVLMPGVLYAAENFGIVFDIQGKAELRTAKGGVVALSKGKHILRPVVEGDRIDVADGKVLVVSVSDNRGYEIGSNSSAIVEKNSLKTLKGGVNVKDGYRIPSQSSGGPIGAIVLRNIAAETCISIISPVNTAVLSATPELKWQLLCKGAGSGLTIKVLLERQVVFEAVTEGDSLRLPEGVLSYGQTYRWLVDGGPYGIVGGTFNIPDRDEVQRLTEKADYYKRQTNDISMRLSYLFFLASNRLNEMAAVEVEKLRKEFPDNEYMKGLR